jgi:peptide/nickel transport system permease protein
MNWIWTFARKLIGLAFTALIAALFAATLVRLAPGADSDERELDARLSSESRDALRDAHAADRNLGRYYANYLTRVVHGDFGTSYSLQRPVRELLADRGPVTLRLAGSGLIAGWVFGFALALMVTQWKNRAMELAASGVSAVLLCLPAALMGILILAARAPWSIAIAAVVMPKVYSYSRGLLEKVALDPHILLARAKGLGPLRILAWHVIPSILPELLALAGITVSLAFSAAIPIEAVCDIPGAGQLAWQAALSRDLPILVTITLLLALITRAANSAADLAIAALQPIEATQ